ncbi:MAG: zinc ribbon domain-containing protein, partial [Candidatus Tectomicrobia bacterium]|nr:zinc ribbon domain-containing protein [Candidatus Tectomicrobia bacterium]
MICDSCGLQVRDGVKFCTVCGVKMNNRCPSCLALTYPGERFCGECGSSLEGTVVALPRLETGGRRSENFKGNMPKQLVEKIERSR